MSGGSLNYFYSQLEEHAGDFGDKELDELVKDLAGLFHDREWYLSADTGVGDWRKARDTFKAKWFTEHGRQERIEAYLAALAKEVRDAFGIGKDYCENCGHWYNSEKHDGEYGDCEKHKGCLWHRLENCEEFIAKEEQA